MAHSHRAFFLRLGARRRPPALPPCRPVGLPARRLPGLPACHSGAFPARRPLALAAALGAALTLAALWGAGSAGAQSPYAARALAAYSAMQKYLYVKRVRLYHGASGRGASYAHVWGAGQALAATVSVSRLPGVGSRYVRDIFDRRLGLEDYWNSTRNPPGYNSDVLPPRGPGGSLFYDDNDWVGLELARLYATEHDPAELTRAEQIFTLETSAWKDDLSLPCPGGVPFTDNTSNADRNTITNAPGAELGVALYRMTRDPTYLQWAERMYEWVRDCLSLGTGLYADHINDDGRLDTTAWTYTQGVMIGAGVLLYRATGEQIYLDQARATEQATMSYFDPGSYVDEPPFFVSVVFRNLLLFNAVSADPRIPQMTQAYADWAWGTQRRRIGLYSFPADENSLLSQSAIINVDAMLVEPIDTFF